MFPIYSLNIVLPLISDALLGNAVQSLCKTVLVCLYTDSPPSPHTSSYLSKCYKFHLRNASLRI